MHDILILLVEDDADDRFLFEQAVADTDSSNRILTAGNGMEALEILEKLKDLPQIVFMDVNMPVMNGLECLQAIRLHSKFGGLVVIMISTATNSEIEQKAYQWGANGFSCKPVTYEGLKEMIAGHLDNLTTATA